MSFSRTSLFFLCASAMLLGLAQADNELQEGFTEEDFEIARTFSGFNSTSLLVALAVGAVIVLLVGVGLYLYDVYADTSRTEQLPNPDYANYYQDQYQNAEYAYPAAQQVYRYVPSRNRQCPFSTIILLSYFLSLAYPYLLLLVFHALVVIRPKDSLP